MNRILVYLSLLALAACLSGNYVYARDYRPEDVPNVQLSDSGSFVSDPEKILSVQSAAYINSRLLALRDSTSVEVAVVVLPTIGSYTPEEFALRVAESWGVGGARTDNGMLILLVTEDRYIRFEVGYGLEGVMTDALSKRIQTRRMAPYLSQGNWDKGVIEGVDAVVEVFTDPDSQLVREARTQETESIWAPMVGMVFFILIISAVVMAASKRRRKCPRCGHKMRVTNTRYAELSRSKRLVTTRWRCPNCGYTDHTNRTENIGGGIIGGLGGGMLGGGFGGSGGGSFGGGWGGGGFGGGGSTTRF